MILGLAALTSIIKLMIEIADYIAEIDIKVLPAAQQKLRACTTTQDISVWRRELCKAIYKW